MGGARGPQEHSLPGLGPGDTGSQCHPSQGLPPSICCLLPPTPSRCLFFFQNIRLPPRQASKGGVPETPTLHTLMSLQLGGGGGGVNPSCALLRECKTGESVSPAVLVVLAHSVPSCTYSPLSCGGAIGCGQPRAGEASGNSPLSLAAKCRSGWVCSRASIRSQLTSSAPLVTTGPSPPLIFRLLASLRWLLWTTAGFYLLIDVCVCVCM